MNCKYTYVCILSMYVCICMYVHIHIYIRMYVHKIDATIEHACIEIYRIVYVKSPIASELRIRTCISECS